MSQKLPILLVQMGPSPPKIFNKPWGISHHGLNRL
ncbi:Uncharacterised protein [Cedecea lapagei]|uniref:Uncharacterized protein n=1 Tax=Cedecea lapagei TaxID=158823 RepID=A0A447V2L6_9ENTR|nr:Uncharacterised protein [Cedecea lapagei]